MCRSPSRPEAELCVLPPTCVRVVPLERATASQVAAALDSLLEASSRAIVQSRCALPLPGRESELWGGSRGAAHLDDRVAADPRTNSIVVASTDAGTLARLVELIARLDDDG